MLRQCGGSSGIVCCELSVDTKPTDCEFETAEMLNNVKEAMMFKVQGF